MRVVAHGIGRGGSMVVDALLEYEATTETDFVHSPIAVGTHEAAFSAIERIPASDRLVPPADSNPTAESDAADDLESAYPDLADHIEGTASEAIHGDLVAVEFTGGQSGPWGRRVVEFLRDRHRGAVYGLAIVPSDFESDARLAAAGEHLQRFHAATDQTIVYEVDPTADTTDESNSYDPIVNRLGLLFTVDDVGDAESDQFPTLDQAAVADRLDGGGFASIGYATDVGTNQPSDGFIAQIWQPSASPHDPGTVTNETLALLRRAVTDGLSAACDLKSTSHAMLLLGGPKGYLQAVDIEEVSSWLSSRTATEATVGAYPFTRSGYIAAVVVLSGLPQIPSLERRFEVALPSTTAGSTRAEGTPTGKLVGEVTDSIPGHRLSFETTLEGVMKDARYVAQLPDRVSDVVEGASRPAPVGTPFVTGLDVTERGAIEKRLDHLLIEDGHEDWVGDHQPQELFDDDETLTTEGRLYFQGLLAGFLSSTSAETDFADLFSAEVAEELDGIIRRRQVGLAGKLAHAEEPEEDS